MDVRILPSLNMKKLLTLCVLMASTMFGLVSCGSGGDNNEREPMTVRQLKGASRQFVLMAFNTITITPTEVVDAPGLNDSETQCTVRGTFKFGGNSYNVIMTYKITAESYDGGIDAGQLTISFEDTDLGELNNNNSFMAEFGIDLGTMDTNNVSYTLSQMSLTIELNYSSWQASSIVYYMINYNNGSNTPAKSTLTFRNFYIDTI